jgi:hypothetical protein
MLLNYRNLFEVFIYFVIKPKMKYRFCLPACNYFCIVQSKHLLLLFIHLLAQLPQSTTWHYATLRAPEVPHDNHIFIVFGFEIE